MSVFRCALICLSLVAVPALAAAPPDEVGCNKAIAAAQKVLVDTPAKIDRDRLDLQLMKERQDQLIADARRKRVSECQIWSEVMKNSFK
jgi:hypothetical protein